MTMATTVGTGLVVTIQHPARSEINNSDIQSKVLTSSRGWDTYGYDLSKSFSADSNSISIFL